MKTRVSLAVAAGLLAAKGESAVRQQPASMSHVAVCVGDGADVYSVAKAEMTASAMLRQAGVVADFHGEGSRFCLKQPREAMVVTFVPHLPKDVGRGTLAQAWPFEGIHIEIFYDEFPAGVRTPLLAHVLVHEIVHLMEHMTLHSESGVMKKRWDRFDFAQMRIRNLSFTAADKLAIHDGLATRCIPEPSGIRTAARSEAERLTGLLQ